MSTFAIHECDWCYSLSPAEPATSSAFYEEWNGSIQSNRRYSICYNCAVYMRNRIKEGIAEREARRGMLDTYKIHREELQSGISKGVRYTSLIAKE